jgi:hypothetical protein
MGSGTEEGNSEPMNGKSEALFLHVLVWAARLFTMSRARERESPGQTHVAKAQGCSLHSPLRTVPSDFLDLTLSLSG